MGKGYIENAKQELTEEILSGISKNGLYASAKEARLRSYDKKNCSDLSLNLVDFNFALDMQNNPTTAHSRQSFLFHKPPAYEQDSSSAYNDPLSNHLAYSSTEGAWGILLERKPEDTVKAHTDDHRERTLSWLDPKFNTKDAPILEQEARLASGLMFILRPPEGEKYSGSDSIVKQFNNAYSILRKPFPIKELQTNKTFQKKDILYIIAPKLLGKSVKKIFPTIKLITVDNILGSVQLSSGFCTAYGPDYVTGIRKIVKDKQLKRFCCHVTRLPTCRDIIQRHQEKLNLTECLKFYKTDDPCMALRRIAAYSNHKEEVMYLIENTSTFNINAQDENPDRGFTALHWSVTNNNKNITSYLLQLKAKTTIKSNKGGCVEDLAKVRHLNLKLLANEKSLEASLTKARLNQSRKNLFGEDFQKEIEDYMARKDKQKTF